MESVTKRQIEGKDEQGDERISKNSKVILVFDRNSKLFLALLDPEVLPLNSTL